MTEDLELKLKKRKDFYFSNLFKSLIEFIVNKDKYKNLKWFTYDQSELARIFEENKQILLKLNSEELLKGSFSSEVINFLKVNKREQRKSISISSKNQKSQDGEGDQDDTLKDYNEDKSIFSKKNIAKEFFIEDDETQFTYDKHTEKTSFPKNNQP